MCGKLKVFIFVLKFCGWVFDVLENEGYICGYVCVEFEGVKFEFEVELKYYNGEFVILDVKCIFKFGCCVYLNVSELLCVWNGLGILIILMLKGVMFDV